MGSGGCTMLGDCSAMARSRTYARPTSIGNANAQKIATPPPSAFGFAWIFRPPGLSTNPRRGAIRLIANVSIHEMVKLRRISPRIGRRMAFDLQFRLAIEMRLLPIANRKSQIENQTRAAET